MVIDGDLDARARADDVSFLLAQFVDLAGKPCAVPVPVAAAEAFQADGVGFAAFAVGAIGQAPSDPDLIAMPDPASYTRAPPRTAGRWSSRAARPCAARSR